MLALWLDPARSARADDLTFLLVLGYTLFADVILLATWNSWWNESRLSAATHAVDLIVFTVLIFLTEGYVSPFFTFFVFLVLAASIRWSWREALLTATLVVALFLAATLVAASSAVGLGGIEIQRFVARAGNLLVLSLMIIWFGVNLPRLKGEHGNGDLDEDLQNRAAPPLEPAMHYAAQLLSVDRILFAWWDNEEPWLNVWELDQAALRKSELRPDEYPRLISDDLAHRPFLFDLPRRRALYLRSGRRHSVMAETPIDQHFATRFGIDSGLAIPIRTSGYEGHIFALRVPGLCSDDLKLATHISEKISAAFERTALFLATEAAAAARARLLLARDLHDSVVQSFAGVSLKLHALHKTVAAYSPAREEIEELQQLLSQDQRELRRLIASLRDPSTAERDTPFAEPIQFLAKRLEAQWGVTCDITADPPSLEPPASLQHDIEQLIRESVANAVRHGGAKLVRISLSRRNGEIGLTVIDDGRGFPIEGEFADAELRERQIGPRSLHERVQSLGGTMSLASNRATGSRLDISMPFPHESS